MKVWSKKDPPSASAEAHFEALLKKRAAFEETDHDGL